MPCSTRSALTPRQPAGRCSIASTGPVGELITGAGKARQKVATFAIDGEIRFAGAADRAAFAEELTVAVTALVARFHDEDAPGGRRHRLVVAVHPTVTREP